MKVRYQILFAFIMLILAFSTATGYFLIDITRTQMINISSDVSEANKKFVKSYINDMLGSKKYDVSKIASDERVIKIYEEKLNGEDKRLGFIELANLKAPYSSVLVFFDSNGNVAGENYEYYKWSKVINIQEIYSIIPRENINKFAISFLVYENDNLFIGAISTLNYLRNGVETINGTVATIMPVNYDLVDDLKNKTGADYMLVLPKGKVVTTFYDENQKRINSDFGLKPSEKSKKIGDKFYSVNYVLLKDIYEKEIGRLYILKDSTEYKKKSEEFFKKEFIIFFIISIAGILIIWAVTFNFIGPLEKLKKTLMKISEGDLGYKVNINLIKRDDEIGFIAKKVDKLKSELDISQKKVKYYTEELESSYKEMKNYLYIVEIKNKELMERLKEQKIIEEILSKGIKEANDTGNFLRFLLKKINHYRKYSRAEIIYKNSLDESYERLVYVTEKDKFIESNYNENLKYLINDRVIIKENYLEMPISLSGQVIGSIKIEGIKLSDNTEKVIDIIVNEIGIVLENAELYQKMDKKIMELSFLNSISIAVSSANNINEMKKMIFDSISVLFGISNHEIYIYEDGYLNEFKEEEGELLKNRHIKIEDPIVYINSKFEAIKVNKDYFIPLAVKEKLIGAIKLENAANYKQMDKNIVRIFLTQLSIVIQNNLMHAENKKKSFGIIKSLAEAIEEKDFYTRGHSERVMKYAIKIAEKMNLPANEIEKIQYAGILHDVGKIGIPENILRKKGMLTDEEYQKIKEHPAKGAKILMHMPSLKDIVSIVKYHHERPDGKGYPEGLKGEEIPIGARILSVADTFDAMTSNRPYRKGLSIEVVKEELLKYSGAQFDANVSEVVIDMLDSGELEIDRSYDD